MPFNTEHWGATTEQWPLAETIAAHTRVYLLAGELHIASADPENDYGTTLQAGNANDVVPVLLINAPGKRKYILSGTCANGDLLYSKALGKVGQNQGVDEQIRGIALETKTDGQEVFATTMHG